VTEIDARALAKQSKRAIKPTEEPIIAEWNKKQAVIKVRDLDELNDALDEIRYRLLTLEVAHNEVIGEINHHNAWLNDFRGRHEILYKLPWYRFYIWLMPHMGLPHFPKRTKLKGIRIRDTMPRMRER
jgi:hypothetical protein